MSFTDWYKELISILSRNRALIEAMELTDLEKEEALFEGKKKKFFREKNADYWNSQQKKGKTEVTKLVPL